VESRLRRPEPSRTGGESRLGDPVIAYERDLIQSAVQQSGGDLPAAAAQLGLSLPALRFRMARLQLFPVSFDDEGDASSRIPGR